MSEPHISFPANALIVREGDPGDTLYVISTGRVTVFQNSPSGEIALAELGPGEFFGEMAIVNKAPRNASVRTLEPTVVLQYQPTDIESLINDRPGIGVRIIEVMAQRLRAVDQAFREATEAMQGH